MWRGTFLQVATYLVVVCLLSITFLVFVNASISFVITDILHSRENVGNDVGTLGFFDELVAMIACPIWGVLSDKIGARTVVVSSYIIIAISLFCFVNVKDVYPGLLLVRLLFSVGGAGASTMVTAILPSLSKTGQSTSATKHAGRTTHMASDTSSDQSHHDQYLQEDLTPNAPQAVTDDTGSFRIAGFVGTAAGCGALLAVFGFLRIPPYLQERQMTVEMALSDTFYLVGIVAILAAIASFFGLRALVSTAAATSTTFRLKSIPVWRMPYFAALAAVQNNAIGLAYLGGFVARASSVGISLFIPLWVNAFYIRAGHCRIDDPSDSKNQCRDAYRLSSAITGASQLTALICAPLFGMLSERFRQRRSPIMLAAAAGIASYTMLAFIQDPRIKGGSIGPFIFLVAALTGLSQVGAIVCSLGILGHAIALSDAQHETRPSDDQGTAPEPTEAHSHETQLLLDAEVPASATLTTRDDGLKRIKGSIAGMYSFAGGLGILLLTKVGGLLFDTSPAAPFWLLSGFNGLLFLGTGISVLANLVSRHSQVHT